MKLHTDIGQLVAQEMQQIIASPEHQSLFHKQAEKSCCEEKCDCSGEQCDKSCKCCKEKVASVADIVGLLIEASEIFDQQGMPKFSLATMAMVDSLMAEDDVTKIDDTHDDTNEIRVKDLFGPKSHKQKDYIDFSEKPFDMEESLSELESDPDLPKFEELLSNRDMLKELDQKRLDELQEAKLQAWLDEQEENEGFLDLNDARVLSDLDLPELSEDPDLEGMYSTNLEDSERDLIKLLQDLKDEEEGRDTDLPAGTKTYLDPSIDLSLRPTLPSTKAQARTKIKAKSASFHDEERISLNWQEFRKKFPVAWGDLPEGIVVADWEPAEWVAPSFKEIVQDIFLTSNLELMIKTDKAEWEWDGNTWNKQGRLDNNYESMFDEHFQQKLENEEMDLPDSRAMINQLENIIKSADHDLEDEDEDEEKNNEEEDPDWTEFLEENESWGKPGKDENKYEENLLKKFLRNV